MGGTKGIVLTLFAAAVALCSLAGSVNAGTGGAPATSLRWHSPSRMDVVRNRLKHFAAAPALRAAERNRWPRSSARTQTATATRGYDEALVAAINEVRARHGLVALHSSDRLEAAAELHSRNMGRRGVFEHESAGGTPFWKRVEQFYGSRGFGYWAVGENLLWASPEIDAAGAVQMWMESPGHRANVLNKQWREIGLSAVFVPAAPGVYGGRDVTIVTADFGIRR